MVGVHPWHEYYKIHLGGFCDIRAWSWAIFLGPKTSIRDTGHSLQGPFSKYIGFTLKKKIDPQQNGCNSSDSAQITLKLALIDSYELFTPKNGQNSKMRFCGFLDTLTPKRVFEITPFSWFSRFFEFLFDFFLFLSFFFKIRFLVNLFKLDPNNSYFMSFRIFESNSGFYGTCKNVKFWILAFFGWNSQPPPFQNTCFLTSHATSWGPTERNSTPRIILSV